MATAPDTDDIDQNLDDEGLGDPNPNDETAGGDDLGGDSGDGGGDDTPANDDPDAAGTDADAEGELSITLGDEEPPEAEDDPGDLPPKAAAAWAKMRIKVREAKRAQLAAEAKAQAEQALSFIAKAPTEIEVGERPKLSDFDFDEDKHAEAIDEWHERKRKMADAKAAADQAYEKDQKAWNTLLERYEQSKAKLRVENFQDAEDAVRANFTLAQQSIILKGGKDSADKLVYAIGNSPRKIAELRSIADHVEFAVAIGEEKAKMKVTTKPKPPVPDRRLQSSVSGAAAVDKPLERLRADARATGDYSKVAEYNRQQQAKQAGKKSA